MEFIHSTAEIKHVELPTHVSHAIGPEQLGQCPQLFNIGEFLCTER